MKRTLSLIIPSAAFIVFAFWMLAVKNGFMLRWYDEMSLFQPGADSLRQFLLYPGGVFRFAGTFLTQFLFYPALGASVLILLWMLCAWITGKAFRLNAGSTAVCLLIPLCLLASVLHFDEICLSFESQGYVFYNTIGFLFSLAAYWLFTAFGGHVRIQSVIAVILPLAYPLAGFFALLPALMCVISLSVRAYRGRKAVPAIASAVSLLLSVIVPQAYYRYFPATTVDNDYLYLKGLPELTMEEYDMYMWTPFAIVTALLLLFVIISVLPDAWKVTVSRIAVWCGACAFAFGILLCVREDGKKSEQFRASVLMTQAIADHDWRKAVHIMSLTKESPSYTMCVLDNLSRAYCGMERRPMGNMMSGGYDFRHDEDFTITAFVDVPVNHHIGRFNQSHRWATEHNVQYGLKVYFIKYTVLNALMNGDLTFARKFNRLLKHTMFHRRWAEEMERYIDDPSLIPSLPDYDTLVTLRAEEIMRGE